MKLWNGLLLAALVLLLATPAAAETPCTANAWLADQYPEIGKIDCTQVGQTQFEGVSIRIIKDKSVSMAQAQPFLDVILEAAPKSLGVYHKLAPSLEFHAIDFIVSPKHAIGAEVKQGKADVCLVAINDDLSVHPASTIGKAFRAVIAHELVHCLQRWNFEKQVDALFATWWAEGSADYLSTLVYAEGPLNLGKWIAKFDAASDKIALTQMTYETYIFFAWMAQEKGPKSVFDWMEAASKQGGHPAQRAALVSFLGAEKLQKFAQDYLDGKIHNVSGQKIGSPKWPATFKIDDDEEEIFTGAPFTILRGSLSFSDGYYNVTAKSGEEPDARFSENNGPWKAIDPKVQAGCDKPVVYRYGAFTLKAMHLVVSAKKGEKQKSCKPCAGLPEQSQCLVGTWALDKDALWSFLQMQVWKDAKIEYNKGITGSATLEFRKDGTAIVNIPKLKISSTLKKNPVTIDVSVSGIQTGTWSTKSSQARICPVSTNMKIDTVTTVKISGQTIVDKQTHTGGQDRTDLNFTCAGKMLTVTSPNSQLNGEPVTWDAVKIK